VTAVKIGESSTLAKRIRQNREIEMPARRYRYTWDQINTLNADYMARHGVFQHGCEAWIGFDDADEDLRIHFRMNPEREVFSVSYRACRIRNEVREASVDQWIDIEHRPCRLGGHRVHFRCPLCSRSTLKLAVLPEGLRCRSCGSITWGSRRERAPQRLIRRANKVAGVLKSGDWSNEPTVRPAYMRIAVFHALKTERARLAEQIYEHMDRQFVRSARVRRLLARGSR
jgi:hypothetical protein